MQSLTGNSHIDSVLGLFEFTPVSEEARSRIEQVRIDCAVLAEEMALSLPHNAELTLGLRKLMEAKDCFVRSIVYDDTHEGDVSARNKEDSGTSKEGLGTVFP